MAPTTPRKGPGTPKKTAPPASPVTPTRISRRLRGENPELNISNPLVSPSKSAKKRARTALTFKEDEESGSASPSKSAKKSTRTLDFGNDDQQKVSPPKSAKQVSPQKSAKQVSPQKSAKKHKDDVEQLPAQTSPPKSAKKSAIPKKAIEQQISPPKSAKKRQDVEEQLPVQTSPPKSAKKHEDVVEQVSPPKSDKKSTTPKKTVEEELPVKTSPPKSAKKHQDVEEQVSPPKSAKKEAVKQVSPQKSAKKSTTPKQTVEQISPPKSAKKSTTPKQVVKQTSPQKSAKKSTTPKQAVKQMSPQKSAKKSVTPKQAVKQVSPQKSAKKEERNVSFQKTPPSSNKKSTDDRFFSMNEMEAFLDQQDKVGNQSTHLFAEFDDDVGDADYHYADFFGDAGTNQDESGDSDSEELEEIEGIDDNMNPFGEPEDWESEMEEMEESDVEESSAKQLLEESGEDELDDESEMEDEESGIDAEDGFEGAGFEESDMEELEDDEENLLNGNASKNGSKQLDFTLTSSDESENEELQQNGKKRVSFAADANGSDFEDEEFGDGMEDDLEEQEDFEEMETDEPQTRFGKEQRNVKDTIAEYERQNMEPRSWELSGEVTAHEREQDGLLKEYIEVDYKAIQAPVIDENANERIESIVKKRIKDKNFDDVIRTKRVDESLQTYRARTTLDDIERKSLMQMYEDEFRRKTEVAKENKNGVEVEEEKLDPETDAIEREMNGIFSKLDALCHARYRPSENQVEPEVIVNKLAINLEEVGQAATTAPDEELLAPEEIAKRSKFVPKSKEERDKTDKLRERRKKKNKQKVIVREKARNGQFQPPQSNNKSKFARKEKNKSTDQDLESSFLKVTKGMKIVPASKFNKHFKVSRD